MRTLQISILSGLLILLSASVGTCEPVRVLTWWDYLSPQVIKRIENAGIKVDLALYKSNEVALSRLISKRNVYDVAIISGANVETLSTLIGFQDIRKELGRTDYIKFLEVKGLQCIPYLWSATVFAVLGDEKVSSLKELIDLKKKRYSIGVVDDAFEILSRSILDHGCSNGVRNGGAIWDVTPNCFDELKELKGLQSKDLKTSTAEFLTNEKSASYGWHGEVKALITKKLPLHIFLPKVNPVVGVDYVCVLKKAKQNKETMRFVQLLTDKEGTRMNVANTGYFSPYMNHLDGLDPVLANLYNQVMSLPAENSPMLITQPSVEVNKQINQMIQKIRYEGK